MEVEIKPRFLGYVLRKKVEGSVSLSERSSKEKCRAGNRIPTVTLPTELSQLIKKIAFIMILKLKIANLLRELKN